MDQNHEEQIKYKVNRIQLPRAAVFLLQTGSIPVIKENLAYGRNVALYFK
ncbi:hypothetical protein [Niallia taxi]|nr:hypothetical protein [Niallia taxi]